jgi:hypothetical protein
MNVADQFLEIELFLAHDRFEAILEKLTVTVVAPVKTDDIAGQQPAHQSGQRSITGPEKKMSVIG